MIIGIIAVWGLLGYVYFTSDSEHKSKLTIEFNKVFGISLLPLIALIWSGYSTVISKDVKILTNAAIFSMKHVVITFVVAIIINILSLIINTSSDYDTYYGAKTILAISSLACATIFVFVYVLAFRQLGLSLIDMANINW